MIHRLFVVLVAGVLNGLTVAGDGGASSSTATGVGSSAGDRSSIVVPSRTVAEVGRTRVIAFEIDPDGEDRTFESHVADSSVLSVARTAAVLADESVGFVRVRGESVGETMLTIGDAALVVEVVPVRAPDAARHRPRIVGPGVGAVVWDGVTVGVEMRLDPSALAEGVMDEKVELALALSVGGTLEPDAAQVVGPHLIASFTIDLDEVPVGPLTLTPLAWRADGLEEAGAGVTVRVVRPGEDLLAMEAEASFEIERPQRFADDRLMIGRDRRASGGAYFSNAASLPAVCVPVDVEEPGWYQMMAIASGSRAAGAPPTIALFVDGQQEPVTNGRLVADDWHRVAVGRPIRLEAGRRILTPYFANDFYVPQKVDRNLRLDRLEIARVDVGAGAGDGAASGGMMGMAGGAMNAAGEGGGMMGMAGGGMAGASDGPFAPARAPLRIAFMQPLDGLPAAGPLEVRGMCWAAGVDPRQSPLGTPLVALEVNGETVSEQRAMAPRFRIDGAHWRRGENTVRMIARLASGAEASTPLQRITFPDFDPPARQPVRMERYTVHHEGWDASLRDHLTSERGPQERFAARFNSNTTVALDLPDDLDGSFAVFVETLGEHFQGPPVGEIRLRTERGVDVIGTYDAPTWWNTRPVGEVDLPPGPKQLEFAFTNDKYEANRGDRNLWLQAILLRERIARDDRAAPIATIRYPTNDQVVFMADAIVLDLADDVVIEGFEVLLDDVPIGLGQSVRNLAGRVYLPLAARTLTPGGHEIRVRARDSSGHVGVSEPVRIHVAADAPETPTAFARTMHVLNRFGYGPDPRAASDALISGVDAWLEAQFAADLDEPWEHAAIGLSLVRFANGGNPYEAARRVIDHGLRTRYPARLRFVLWAENHFSTWIRKAEADRKWAEHRRFVDLGVAPFGDLLRASAESPAMLRYLDQDQSFVGRLNENYAREIMELHTLGVDGRYDQSDVTSLAALLTGWTATQEGDGGGAGRLARVFTPRFDPRLNDGDAREVIGMRFGAASPAARADRIEFILETLAAHPDTARHIARKLAEHYVSVPAPAGLVDDLAAEFAATGGDLRRVLLALARHDAFLGSMEDTRMAQPLGYALRLARTSGWDHPWAIGDFLQRSGAGLFDRATPDGYPEEDEAYSDSNAMVQRWRMAKHAEWGLVSMLPNPQRYTQAFRNDEWRQRVIDLFAIRLTGDVLGSRSNEAALAFLREAQGDSNQQTLQLAVLIAQLPEANQR